MKSNRQARHILGLNYKLSNQRKVVIEGDLRQRTPAAKPMVFLFMCCGN